MKRLNFIYIGKVKDLLIVLNLKNDTKEEISDEKGIKHT